MQKNVIRNIDLYIRRAARPLEACLWRVLFHGAEPVIVADALTAFQNEDGGFGHALEADNWNPESTPCATQFALNALNMAGFDDRAHPAVRGVTRYIASGRDRAAYGWRFTLPENDRHPHAPWWNHSEEQNEREYYGVTADFAAYMLTHAEGNDAARALALSDARALSQALLRGGEYGDMGLEGFIHLTDALEASGAQGFDLPVLRAALAERVRASIERGAGDWAHYGVRPSNFIHSPASPFYPENKRLVDKELDFLLDTLPEDGVWGIPWTWFQNMEAYAPQFYVSEGWWKAFKAIEKALFLRAFGRI